MVKASPSPVSSLIVQLRYLLHMPLMGANPTGRKGQKQMQQRRSEARGVGGTTHHLCPPPAGRGGSHLRPPHYDMGTLGQSQEPLHAGQGGLVSAWKTDSSGLYGMCVSPVIGTKGYGLPRQMGADAGFFLRSTCVLEAA